MSYFFVPRSVGLTRHTYGREHFYRDVQAYIRFKTPTISLAQLSDPGDPMSPLATVRSLLGDKHALRRDRKRRQRIGHELRMFGCVARARLRDKIDRLGEMLRELAANPDLSTRRQDAQVALAGLLDDIDQVLAAWRELRPLFVSGELAQALVETYELVDEYLSLVVEDKLTELVERIDRDTALSRHLADGRRRARDLLVSEHEHRAGAGYPLADDEDEEGSYLYRRGVLKKLVASVLWLDIDKEQEGKGSSNVGAAIAAGTAMLFTVLATILHMHWFMINTAGFVIAATITYMLKDRIKDWLKGYFAKKSRRWLADYSVRVRDPITGAVLGRCRESFGYADAKTIPEPVWALRHASARSSIEALSKPEVVLRYEKEVHLDGNALIERLHLEDFDINDIIRFSVAQLQTGVDDPKTEVARYDVDTDEVARAKLRKVYHLNVILVLDTDERERAPSLRHLRVVFDKKKILRVEEAGRAAAQLLP